MAPSYSDLLRDYLTPPSSPLRRLTDPWSSPLQKSKTSSPVPLLQASASSDSQDSDEEPLLNGYSSHRQAPAPRRRRPAVKDSFANEPPPARNAPPTTMAPLSSHLACALAVQRSYPQLSSKPRMNQTRPPPPRSFRKSNLRSKRQTKDSSSSSSSKLEHCALPEIV